MKKAPLVYSLLINIVYLQRNSRKGIGRCRLSCLCAKGYIDSVYSVTNSRDNISRTLSVNSLYRTETGSWGNSFQETHGIQREDTETLHLHHLK